MATQLLVDIEQVVHQLCAERAILVESVRFFGSRALGTAQAESDVDILLVSSAFEGKDIFQLGVDGVARVALLAKRGNRKLDNKRPCLIPANRR